MQPQPKQQEPETRTEPTPLERVLDDVKRDAARDPDAYARETVVPEGGE